MDSRTGVLYGSLDEAIKAGVPRDAVVEMDGFPGAIERVSAAVRRLAKQERRKARPRPRPKNEEAKKKARRLAEQKSRRRNRRRR